MPSRNSHAPTADLAAARDFVAGHARLLERRRLAQMLDAAAAASTLEALDAYRNPDSGYGWGLEPDLRSTTSQPVAAMHAMEVFAEGAPASTERGVELLDWLESRSAEDGGIPLALPVPDPAGSSSIWTAADTTASSLQMTSQIAAHAHRLGRKQPIVREHPWLIAATRFCLEAIGRIKGQPKAHELMFSLRLLDAAAPHVPEADAAVEHLGPHIPPDGVLAVQGGTGNEKLHPLDLSPWPDSASRRLFDAEVITADLDRVAAGQRQDGGWVVDFESVTPTAALEWRGYATVNALAILRAAQQAHD